jgi:hypothetical protein
MGAELGLPMTECAECAEQLEPGDRMLLYTDGVIEARDADGQQFGWERFVDFILRRHSGEHTLALDPAPTGGNCAGTSRRQARRRRHLSAHRVARRAPAETDFMNRGPRGQERP